MKHVTDICASYLGLVFDQAMCAMLISLPLALVLMVGFQYAFALDRSERSLWAAIRSAFPKEDYKAVTTRTDIFCSIVFYLLYHPIVESIILKILIPIASGEIGYSILVHVFGRGPFVHLQPGWVVVIQTSVIYVATDFGLYVVHYLEHRIPILWADHKVHHSGEVLTPITGAGRKVVLPTPNVLFVPIAMLIITGPIVGLALYAMDSPTVLPATARSCSVSTNLRAGHRTAVRHDAGL